MGFFSLRVINDDVVAPGAGFGTHGHRDMEIISYVLESAIEHKDSMGNQFIIPAGEMQRMSAGTGVTHSEYNHSDTENLRFLQIWIPPAQGGIAPSYEQKQIVQQGKLTPLVTPDGIEGSLTIHQDASLNRLQLAADDTIALDTQKRPGYLHVIEGSVNVEGTYQLTEGDGLGLFEETAQLAAGGEGVTALWFDLPNTPNLH
jgi:redox-sensitive bicupin YhaK (pirin superfamily)